MNARPIHRFISFIIDLVVTGLFSLIIGYRNIIMLFDTLSVRSDINITNLFTLSLITGAIIMITAIAYYLVLPLYWKKQTIGRYLARIAIVKDDGSMVDFETLFLREVIGRMLGALVSLGFAVVVDGYLISQVERKSFADHLARTRVIDT